jgi:hypothetical protein
VGPMCTSASTHLGWWSLSGRWGTTPAATTGHIPATPTKAALPAASTKAALPAATSEPALPAAAIAAAPLAAAVRPAAPVVKPTAATTAATAPADRTACRHHVLPSQPERPTSVLDTLWQIHSHTTRLIAHSQHTSSISAYTPACTAVWGMPLEQHASKLMPHTAPLPTHLPSYGAPPRPPRPRPPSPRPRSLPPGPPGAELAAGAEPPAAAAAAGGALPPGSRLGAGTALGAGGAAEAAAGGGAAAAGAGAAAAAAGAAAGGGGWAGEPVRPAPPRRCSLGGTALGGGATGPPAGGCMWGGPMPGPGPGLGTRGPSMPGMPAAHAPRVLSGVGVVAVPLLRELWQQV